MPFNRFDNVRLTAVAPGDVLARTCEHTDALVRACRLGAGPATKLLPWQAPRIEWPYGVFHVRDIEVARRACLQLDGSWGMEDAGSSAGRARIRLAAVAADWAWWRALRTGDAWDAGVARSVAALAGFRPRRATLIVVDHSLVDEAAHQTLADLAQQAPSWHRAVRLVIAGGAPPAFARPVGVG